MRDVERVEKAYQLLSDYILRHEDEMSNEQMKDLKALVVLLENGLTN